MKWKDQIDAPLSQYTTFDDKHNVKVSFNFISIQIYHTVKELQVKNTFSDLSRSYNS